MDKPPIFLLTVDTLRADYLSCYREDAYISTPNLDSLAMDGEVYLNVMSCANQTVPSYAALLTGRYPSSLGMKITARLDDAEITLPRLLKRQGYHSACWTVASAVGRENGVAKDFDRYELIPTNKFMPPPLAIAAQGNAFLQKVARFVPLEDPLWRVMILQKYWLAMNDGLGPSGGPVILEGLKELCDGARQPLFVLANFFDPHSPYHPPRRHWREELSAREYLSVMKFNLGHWNNVRRSKELSDQNRRVLRRLYKSEVTYVDELIGDFIDYLKAQALYEDALIILIADHGESLGDHGLLGHWHVLYEDLIHIPMIIKWPGNARRGQVAHLVQNVDVFPTLVDYLQIEDAPLTEGISLLDPMLEDRLGIAEQLDNPADIYKGRPEFDQWQAKMSDFNYTAVAFRQGSYKYIAYSDGRRELFDLTRDPGEVDNLVEVEPERAADFERMIEQTGRDNVLDDVTDWEEEVLLGHLAQLGYI